MLSNLSLEFNEINQSKYPYLNKVTIFTLLFFGVVIPISHGGAGIAMATFAILSLVTIQQVQIKTLVQNNYLSLLFLIFYAWMILSLIYTTADLNNATHDLIKYSRLALIPFMMVFFANDKIRNAAIIGFLLVMSITSVLAYGKFMGLLHFKTLSADDVFMNRIQTGFLTAFAAFIAAHRMSIKQHFHLGYFLLCVLFTFNMILTNTGRTGLLVFLGLAILFIIQKFNTRNRNYLLGTFLIIVLLFINLSNHYRAIVIEEPLENLVKLQQGSAEVTSIGARLTMAKYAAQIASHHPILGTGIGSHRTEYARYNLIEFNNGLKWGDPHNQYLLIFFELGAVGLSLLLYIFYTQIRLSFNLPSDTKYLAQGLVLATVLGCFCDSLLYLSSTGLFYAYFSALCFAGARR